MDKISAFNIKARGLLQLLLAGAGGLAMLPVVAAGLNDTGITFCGDATTHGWLDLLPQIFGVVFLGR